jgi:hypothetical protein
MEWWLMAVCKQGIDIRARSDCRFDSVIVVIENGINQGNGIHAASTIRG